MKITPVVLQLQQRCPVFGERVSGGIDFDAAFANQQPSRPAALVIATGSTAGDNDLANGVRQAITDSFDVVVLLDNPDHSGAQAADALEAIRLALWRALVGWQPGDEYALATFKSAALLRIDSSQVAYRFSFQTAFQLGRNVASQPAETWHEQVLDGLPALEGLDIDVDCIDPADRNLKHPGPDGRIEIHLKEDLT